MKDYVPCSGSCTYELPAHTVSDCEVQNDEKITELRFGYNGKPLTSATPVPGANFATQTTARAEEWADRLDNSSDRTTMPDAIRFLKVPDFLLPPVDQATKTTQSGRLIGAAKTGRTVEGVIDDDSDAMYELLSNYVQCPKTILFWFVSGGHVYGGKTGFEATVLASYKINDDNVSHSWAVRISFTQRGGTLLRDPLLV
jgi:hypothetical protein